LSVPIEISIKRGVQTMVHIQESHTKNTEGERFSPSL